MAIPGQRFELDLDADNWSFNPVADEEADSQSQASIIKEIREHDSSDAPPPPKIKQTKSGFPEHKSRSKVSAFKRKQEESRGQKTAEQTIHITQPSDAAIRHRVASKYGYDPAAQEKAKISKENEERIAAMSEEDIEEARAELMQSLSPAMVERLLRRANIDEDQDNPSQSQGLDGFPDIKPAVKSYPDQSGVAENIKPDEIEEPDDEPTISSQPSDAQPSSIHFPVPNRDPSSYKPLDPDSVTFLDDLRTTYFPELSHTPSTLNWLNESTPSTEPISHSYAPDLDSYPASSLRFNFAGSLIPPNTSLSIPVTAGLHHHGNAPSSAGYTIPELTLLARSTLPNQRCIAYQTIGRILHRLGTGDFGQKGSELCEAMWAEIEDERVVEVVMREANADRGHASAKAYATEALWLWRKGGGGERGMKKPGETRAK